MNWKLSILPLLLLLVGCRPCDCKCVPEDGWRYVRIEFDTIMVPDADPEGMTLALYPSDGSSPWTFQFTGLEGDVIEIPNGDYSVLAYNNDTYRTIVENPERFSDCAFTTPEGQVFEGLSPLIEIADPGDLRGAIPGGPPDGEEEIRRVPQMMWCGVIDDLDIDADGTVTVDGEVIPGSSMESPKEEYPVVTVKLAQAVANVTVNISNVANLSSINQLCGIVTGVSGSYRCASGLPENDPVAMPFSINKVEGSDDTLTAKFRIFGKSDVNRQSWMLLYVWLNGGERFYYKFNVTDMILNAPDPKDIHINFSGITIPESIGDQTSGGGLDVGVDGWNYVIIDITS